MCVKCVNVVFKLRCIAWLLSVRVLCVCDLAQPAELSGKSICLEHNVGTRATIVFVNGGPGDVHVHVHVYVCLCGVSV